MATFGIDKYGQSVYGYTTPPAYSADPFTAQPSDYSSISLAWTRPQGTILAWRLVKNMQGFPADQDDGVILADSTSGYPGSSYLDISVTPGRYHYYALYVLVNQSADTWINAGVTGCLMVYSYGFGNTMLNLIPAFYINLSDNNDELEVDPTGNLYLNSFMNVFGWGMDYLKTQYDTYLNFNNSEFIPLNNLYSLAEELGMDINPAISPATLRKAVYYNAIVNKSKGTLTGIQEEISALTGWFANLTLGPNLMLNNDQSYFADPSYPTWSPYITYAINEIVQYQNYNYICISTANYGHPPTGIDTNNTWWDAEVSIADATTLANSVTGGIGTWEGIYAVTPNTVLPSGGITELTGITDPIDDSINNFNGLEVINNNSTTSDLWLRSVSRTAAEIPTANSPDNSQAIGDGIPVPYTQAIASWSADIFYAPQEIVTYSSQPFIALRENLNSVPPYATPGASSEDWAPLGFDTRFRFATSAYIKGSALVAVPFVEWYDSSGNFIIRVFARNSGTNPSLPAGIAYDSFVTGAGELLSSYSNTDDGNYEWITALGDFTITPFANGSVIPSSESARSIATINTGTANCQVGLTFVSTPTSGMSTGLLLRSASTTSYLRADMTQLIENNGGTITTLGTYSSPCSIGDRILVQMNGSSVTVLKNNVSVLEVTSSFNSTETSHGIIYETSYNDSSMYTDIYTSNYA